MTSEVNVMHEFTPSFKNLNFKYPTKEYVHNSTMNMFDYYADKKKKAFFMLDYFSGKIGKDEEMNIMFENGEYATQSQIEERKKQYAKYIENSNIYKMVISFPEGYLEENVDIKEFEKALAKDIIPMFLKKCGFLDMDKMSYQFSLHTNTDNLHFHLSFAEKEPNYKRFSKDKELQYRFAGELSQEELTFLKNEIQHYIKKEKIYTPLLIETNKELDNLKKYFNPKDRNFLLNNKEDILLEDKIVSLGKLLDEKNLIKNNKLKFNSIKDKEIKQLTKEIKNYLFKSNNAEFNLDYKEFKESLEKINQYFIDISKNNHTEIVDTSLIDRKEKYFDNYVLNAIVNHASYRYKNPKISEEEMIQNIVYQNYRRNKNQSRSTILMNCLSSLSNKNKFKNHYRIKQAVKNINDELEDAEKEFDKLFKIDEKDAYL